MDKIAERVRSEQKAAALRAGLIASSNYNTAPGRKPGSKTYKPSDFVRNKPKDLSPEEIRQELLGWARAVNRGQEN